MIESSPTVTPAGLPSPKSIVATIGWPPASRDRLVNVTTSPGLGPALSSAMAGTGSVDEAAVDGVKDGVGVVAWPSGAAAAGGGVKRDVRPSATSRRAAPTFAPTSANHAPGGGAAVAPASVGSRRCRTGADSPVAPRRLRYL